MCTKDKRCRRHRYKKITTAVLVICVCVWCMTGIVHAESLSGQTGELCITNDSNYITISFKGIWSNYLSTTISVSSPIGDLRNLSQIKLNTSNQEEQGEFQVLDAWNQAIPGATGTVKNMNPGQYWGYETMEWNLQIPVSVYSANAIESLTFTWEGNSTTIWLDKDEEETTEESTESTTEDITESTTEATTEAATEATTEGDIVVTDDIVIDGFYRDWEAIPKTLITYLNNNTTCNHYGQLAIKGDRLYGHFKASDLYNSEMRVNIWIFEINGQRYQVEILHGDENGVDWSKPNPTQEGLYRDMRVYLQKGNRIELDSEVALRIYDSNHASDTPGDEIEFSISLSKLAQSIGIAEDQFGVITVYNPNLGNEGVSVAGSSTAPMVGIALCVAVVVGVSLYKRKRHSV